MTDNEDRRFSPERSEELRKAYLDGPMMGQISGFMKDNPHVQAVGLAVAQYWNDEASDAVHLEYFPTTEPVLDLDAYYDWEEKMHSDEADLSEDNPLLPGTQADMYSVFHDWLRATDSEWYMTQYRLWNDNYDAISLFGCFVEHEGSQNNSSRENYNLFCIYRKDAHGDISWEYTCDKHRPWVDGCWPEYAETNQLNEPEKGPMLDMTKQYMALKGITDAAAVTVQTKGQKVPGTQDRP